MVALIEWSTDGVKHHESLGSFYILSYQTQQLLACSYNSDVIGSIEVSYINY